MQYLLATHNLHKEKEFKELLQDISLGIISLKTLNDTDDVLETGTTFLENAILKAKYFAHKYQMTAIADDSGLCVAALNLKPGIYSARYSGNGDLANNLKVLNEMKDQKNRNAYFECVIAICSPQGDCHTFHGRIDGSIGYQIQGENGFGYDSIFYPEGYDQTFAELDSALKNQMSHRFHALRQFENFIK